MSSGNWVRFTALTICVLVAGAVGLQRAWASATVDPPSPPSVCQLIRPELFDLLVPRHEPLQAEGAEGSRPGTRSNTCATETTSTLNGSRASLWVALVRFGRHDGQGPQCVKRDGSLLMPLNRTSYRITLGDAAVYFFEGDPDTGRVIHLSACLGTYLVYVRYEAVGATDASMVESAATVGQEVLSWL
ncbi:hypothetical protein [Micromonospora sp. NPDC005806]|uniref:hypothetical protein n=1 Tax=Micromonospora sp. NPDC005806 TaxID=3364234 RepID=UPI0036A42C58